MASLFVSRHRVFQAGIEIFFGYFSNQHVKRCQPNHCQHKWSRQRNKSKQETDGQIWQYKSDTNNDRCAYQKSVPGLLRKNKPCVRTNSAITNSVSKDSMNQPVRNSSGEARKINNSIPTAWLGLC